MPWSARFVGHIPVPVVRRGRKTRQCGGLVRLRNSCASAFHVAATKDGHCFGCVGAMHESDAETEREREREREINRGGKIEEDEEEERNAANRS